MAKLLAIEWDEREARVAVASPHGSEVVVEDAFAIDISAAVAADAADDSREAGRRIAEVLAQRGLTGSDALVGVGRASIELRSMSLPPAPPEEWPDMVRFQAMQAFTTIGEDWPLDFVELRAQDDALNVLAAVLSPKQVEQILQVCAASELKPRCLVLRPFAAASLLNRSQVLAAGRNALIVDMLADGADLTIIAQGQVVFVRTVRLVATDDPSVQARALVGEARRTIGAAQAQMSGQRIEQITICGSATEHPVLAQSLAEALSLDVVVFDPFQAMRLARTLEQQLPSDSGRYAPLLGMLADDAAGVRHAIDFLNPRKRPVAHSHRRRNVWMAAGTLAAVGVVGLGIWAGLKYLDHQIAGLKEEAAELDKQVAVARELMANTDAVADFIHGDVTWLDEIRELACRMPDADHVKLNDVIFATDAKRGGTVTLKGHVKSSDVIAEFEDSLRYEGHVVSGKSAMAVRNATDYPYALDTTVTVEPDKYDRGRSQGRPHREQLRKQPAAPQGNPQTAVESERPPAAEPGHLPKAEPDSAPAAKPDSAPAAEPDSAPAAKPDSAPAAKPEPGGETKPKTTPDSTQAEAPTSEMKKVEDQQTEATGSDNS